MADAREDKLPQWAQKLIRDARREVAITTEEARQLREENDRLHNLLDGKYAEEDRGTADTFLVTDEGKKVPLGKRPDIQFVDFYTVYYGTEEITGGARALVVTTAEDMVIRPTFDPRTIVIARA